MQKNKILPICDRLASAGKASSPEMRESLDDFLGLLLLPSTPDERSDLRDAIADIAPLSECPRCDESA